MLHLNFGLNFEALAEDLMKKLKQEWRDPFEPPVLILPDLTLGDWFKLKWIEQYGALANLNSQFLDKFLFETLADNPNSPIAKVRLSGGLLQHLILAWFKLSDDNIENWQTLGTDDENNEVENYLKGADGRPDESRLFDLSGEIARLFMEYETSRPGTFKTKDGLINAWTNTKEDRHFFNKANPLRESWQKKLYQKLMVGSNCVLESLNRELKAQNLQFEYITLPRLFENNRKNKVVFPGAPKTPIFIFWHAGIGQFYRVALSEYAKTHEVHAYIQNPCMEFWEEVEYNKVNHCMKAKFRKSLTGEDAVAYEESDENPKDNQLLAKWGRAGRDNIRLWCESVNYDFKTFEEEKSVKEYEFGWNRIDVDPNTSHHKALHIIQDLISHQINPDKSMPFANDETLTVHGAPSKIREIEHLHSQICLLLQSGAQLRDILVVAPNINDYRTAINQIFAAERTQAEDLRKDRKISSEKAETALYLPFTIIDGEPRESLTARALNTLFRICSAKTLSRLEFFDLVRNPVVQRVRGIVPEEVSAWEGWLTGMQIFRDRQLPQMNDTNGQPIDSRDHSTYLYEDWNTGIKRLLLARMTDCRVDDNGETFQPYADIDSADSGSLYRFVDAVESLERLCKDCNTVYAGGISLDALNQRFIPHLNDWIAMKDVPREMGFENIIYQNVMNSIDDLKCQYTAGLDRISMKCMEHTILGAAETSRYTVGSLFVNGLTFMNFTANRIIPIKHCFFLGLDAAGFPGRDMNNSLDLRTGDIWPGDNLNAPKNRYAFLCQLMSTSDSLHLSFVNKNLQKDEEFFPSSIINDLFDFVDLFDYRSPDGQPRWTPAAVPLDETRDINELFTQRSIRNQPMYRCMIETHADIDTSQSYYENTANPYFKPNELPERVTLSKLKKYLKDPFQFRIGEIFQSDDDDIDPEKMVYEPIDVDNVELIDIIKCVAQLIIRKDPRYGECYIQQPIPDGTVERKKAPISQEEAEKGIEKAIHEYMQSLKESGFRTYPLYEDLLRKKIELGAVNVAEQLLEHQLVRADDDNAVDFSITQRIGQTGEEMTWHLQGQADWHVWGQEEPALAITGVSLGKPREQYVKYLTTYISALALIAQKDCRGMTCHVQLNVCCTGGGKLLTREFDISPEEAIERLKTIYQYAYIDQYAVAAPIKILEDNKTGPRIKSFEDLENNLKSDENGAWRYFKKGKMFNLRTDIGFDAFNHEAFVEQWNAAKEHQLRLVDKLQKGDNLFFVLNPEDRYKTKNIKDDIKTSDNKSKSGKK